LLQKELGPPVKPEGDEGRERERERKGKEMRKRREGTEKEPLGNDKCYSF